MRWREHGIEHRFWPRHDWEADHDLTDPHANVWGTVVDIFGSYRFNGNLSANFSVENVTDEYHLPPLFVNRMPSRAGPCAWASVQDMDACGAPKSGPHAVEPPNTVSDKECGIFCKKSMMPPCRLAPRDQLETVHEHDRNRTTRR